MKVYAIIETYNDGFNNIEKSIKDAIVYASRDEAIAKRQALLEEHTERWTDDNGVEWMERDWHWSYAVVKLDLIWRKKK